VLAVCVATITTSCSRKSTGAQELTGITNFSYSIFTATEHPIPDAGTFGWGPRYFRVQDLPGTNLTEVDQRIRESVRTELEARGFVYSEMDPDILVGYGLAMNAPIDEAAMNKIYGEEFDFTFQTPIPDERRTYHQGTLVLDFLNAETSTLLWRGIARGDVDVNVTETIKDQRARELAHLLIARYPDPSVVVE
jgi:hypothetical protein